MKVYLILIFCFTSFKSFCQLEDEVLVKVDSNFSMRLYDSPTEKRANGSRVLSYSRDDISYQVIINDSLNLSAKNKRMFDISLKGIQDGFINSSQYKSYAVTAKDTLLNEMPGKFMHFYNAPANMNVKELFLFVTLQNSHAYMIVTAAYKKVDDKIKKTLDHFYNMLVFKGKLYDEFPDR